MELNEYMNISGRTAPENDNEVMALMNFALGASGEGGEIADYVKKCVFQGHRLDPDKLAKELGDELWYLARLAELIGHDLETVAQMNIDKLKKRYPEGFDEKASRERVE